MALVMLLFASMNNSNVHTAVTAATEAAIIVLNFLFFILSNATSSSYFPVQRCLYQHDVTILSLSHNDLKRKSHTFMKMHNFFLSSQL